MNFYRMRYGTDDFAVTDAYTYAAYTLLPGTTAQSWVVPCGGSWHVRVHKIVTTSPVDIADGGFALSVEEPFTRRVGAEDGKVLLQRSRTSAAARRCFCRGAARRRSVCWAAHRPSLCAPSPTRT